MVALSNRPATAEPANQNRPQSEPAYRVFWRLRSSGAWRREEFQSRADAYDRYFNLMRKGLELRWGSV
jgi:hypothetical protein